MARGVDAGLGGLHGGHQRGQGRGRKHDYDVDANQELKALGMANVLGAFFQSYPTTGGFSRTAVTEQSGGKTPVTAWIAAAVVALTLVC